MSTTEAVEVDSVSLSRSASPIKPDDEAMEPSEGAQWAASPAASDVEIQERKGENSKSAEDILLSATGVVTKQMIEEEEKLEQEGELEQQRLKEEQDKIWNTLEESDREQRYQRLNFLLQRSNMYTEYLIQRMKRQQEEEERRKERLARKVAKQEEKHQAENSMGNGQETSTSSSQDSSPKQQEGSSQGLSQRVRKRKTVGKESRLSSESTNKRQRLSDSTPKSSTKESENISDDSVKTEVDGIKRLFDGEPIPDDQPVLMNGGILRPYQIEGYQWLKTLYENGVNGILADEMGLGKTVQCIAMVAHMVYMGVPGPFLICAPLSTIPNWYAEFQRFAPRVPVMLYHGSKDERMILRTKIPKRICVHGGVMVHPCIITSYEVAMMDRRFLQNYDWRYLIVDEGHRIKNTHCRLISALRMYRTTNRLLLTGTPLQNNLAELWSLLNFLLPEIFDDLGSFEAWFDVEHIGDGSVCKQIAADEQRKNVLSMLHQILTPFMLRRLKTDVDLRIPPKKEVLVYAPLRPLQQEFYSSLIDRTILAKIREKNGTEEKIELDRNGRPVRKASKVKINYSLMLASEKDEKLSKTRKHMEKQEEDLDGWVQAIIDMRQKKDVKPTPEQKVSQLSIKLHNVMMQLRKCCSHPFLLEHPLDPNTGELSIDERIISESGKMMVLDRMLGELKKHGHKVLIFSQMTKMLDLLEDFCILRKYQYCRLDGAMNMTERKDNMHEYQKLDSNKFIFLLSTRAGGLGINLTAADTVIIYDSDWNPQCDLQAQDRCHRIGQTRPVMVYRLITANTIDQRIVERAAAKRKLEKMVIHQGKFKSGMKNFKTSLDPLSSEELMELLNSKDYESEVRSHDDQIITHDELMQLLDRSDLEAKWARACNKPCTEIIQGSQQGKDSLLHNLTPSECRPPAKTVTKRQRTVKKVATNAGNKTNLEGFADTSTSVLFRVIDDDEPSSVS